MNINNSQRSSWIDHLRSFITFLVIAHHSALAYTTFAVFNKGAYILSTHPVVDTQRSVVMDIFVGFNDTFFMSLMFFISGLFALKSLRKKGPGKFLWERLVRLFVPFVIGVTFFNLVAYYPSYLLSGKPLGLKNYVIDFFFVEAWPVGPLWFIWVLFFYNCLLALFYKFVPSQLYNLSRFVNALKPYTFMIFFVCLTWALLVPLIMLFGPYSWAGLGPFDFQKSRVLVYLGYFLIGCFIGSDAVQTEFLPISDIYKKWPYLLTASVLLFVLMLFAREPLAKLDSWPGTLIYFTLASCLMALASLSFLCLFKRFSGFNSDIVSAFSVNAYGIYLVHYVSVIWCQYLLLAYTVPVILKFSITLFVSVVGSWLFITILKKVPFMSGII